MDFASDNWPGASPKVRDALLTACEGSSPAYGGDETTQHLTKDMSALFEREVAVALVATGTAANALGLAALCPPQGFIYAHKDAHIVHDECGAVESYTLGARIVTVADESGRISPNSLLDALASTSAAGLHYPVKAALSITQTSESGTLYSRDDIVSLTSIAKRHGMGVHMDGARFANAVVALGMSPADITWRAGVDVLCFGGTKNGALMAEAIVFFDPARAERIEWLRKRGGHVVSKTRFLAAQFLALLERGHWLDLARHANDMAAQLAAGLTSKGYAPVWPCEANEVFTILPNELIDELREAGARFHEWPVATLPLERQPADGSTLIRLVASFATPAKDVQSFINIL